MNHRVEQASTLPVTWWKSSRSDSGAQCVECGIVEVGALVAVRDSKAPSGPALVVSCRALGALVAALGAEEM